MKGKMYGVIQSKKFIDKKFRRPYTEVYEFQKNKIRLLKESDTYLLREWNSNESILSAIDTYHRGALYFEATSKAFGTFLQASFP